MKTVWIAGLGDRGVDVGVRADDDLQARRRERPRDLLEQAHEGRDRDGARTAHARFPASPAGVLRRTSAARKAIAPRVETSANAQADARPRSRPRRCRGRPILAVGRAADAEEARQRSPQDPRGGAAAARKSRSTNVRNSLIAGTAESDAHRRRARRAAGDGSHARRSMVEMRANIDKASGRIRGLQATVAEHEKNIEALKKELGALKP